MSCGPGRPNHYIIDCEYSGKPEIQIDGGPCSLFLKKTPSASGNIEEELGFDTSRIKMTAGLAERFVEHMRHRLPVERRFAPTFSRGAADLTGDSGAALLVEASGRLIDGEHSRVHTSAHGCRPHAPRRC
eukprot:6975813-Pyramimonas_sp.AAC.1